MFITTYLSLQGFLGGSDSKVSAYNLGDPSLIPGSGRRKKSKQKHLHTHTHTQVPTLFSNI